MSAPPIARNAPCPCGSGLRYKECHGKLQDSAPNPDELIARALNFHQQGRIDEAERLYKQVLALQARHAVATHFLGMVAWHRGDASTAEQMIRESIALDGNVPDFHNNLGLLLRDKGRIDDALACFAKTLAIDPDWLEAYNNQALALESNGRFDDAIAAYRTAIERNPRFAAARQNLARVLLMRGEFAEGWTQYRWRLQAQRVAETAPDETAPRLPQDLSGQHIALMGEQGLGDVLFFLRFVPELRRRGAKVAFEGDPRLAPLLARTGLFESRLEPARRAFAGDLPWLLDVRDPPAYPPLALVPDATRVARWRETLSAWGPPPYVALTWRAGTATLGGPVRQQLKQTSAEALAEAAGKTAGTWISVQRLPRDGEREAVEAALGAKVHDASGANEDLDDILALMSVVDDYAGVSNLNTHLRAGVGATMRVLVPFPPEWRWMEKGERSPWFPTARVARLT